MKQLGELTVADYMTAHVVAIEETASIADAIKLMEDQRLSSLPVIDDARQLVGILSVTDLFKFSHDFSSDLAALTKVKQPTRDAVVKAFLNFEESMLVRDVMTWPVQTVRATENLVVAARRLWESGIHHLPVVDDYDQLQGVISTSDFVRIVADFGAFLAG